MKITFVLDTFGGGGKERRCLQLIQGLNSNGYNEIQVIVVNDDKVAYQELYETKSKIYIIARKNNGLSFKETVQKVNELIKSFKPDIVQSWGVISTLIPIILKPFNNYKLIGAYVADANKIKTFSWFSIFPFFCDKIVGNSLIGLRAYNVPQKKAVLIYNGFNEKRLENEIDSNLKKKSLNINTPYVVAMLAMFWWHKDWKCYLNAAKKIIHNRKDITFLAVGGGKTWEEHNSLIEENERSNIRMLGRRDDIDELLQVCDLTVLVSNHGEGISNSILESMAFGVPVIATNSGGTTEIIDNNNGILLNKNDVDLLIDNIQRLLNNEEERLKFSNNAKETVRKRFLLKNMTQKYIELFHSLI